MIKFKMYKKDHMVLGNLGFGKTGVLTIKNLNFYKTAQLFCVSVCLVRGKFKRFGRNLKQIKPTLLIKERNYETNLRFIP